LYDYLTLVGETNWYAAPAAVISTKNVEAIRTSIGSTSGLTGPEVIAAAIGTPDNHAASSAAASAAQPAPKAPPVPKKANNQ
jgi:hypothetical protein